jgi:hypothetical protein
VYETVAVPKGWKAYQVDLPAKNISILSEGGILYAAPDVTLINFRTIKAFIDRNHNGRYDPGSESGTLSDVKLTSIPTSGILDPSLQNNSSTVAFDVFVDNLGILHRAELPTSDSSAPDWQPPDDRVFYYNEPDDIKQQQSSDGRSLEFFDAPTLGQGTLLPGQSVQLTTELAGVSATDGKGITWTGLTTNFTWTTNAEGTDPNVNFFQVTDPRVLPPLASGGVSGVQFTDAVPNSPPILAPIADRTVTAGSTLTFTATAIDPDFNESLTFSLDPGAPNGASIDPKTGVFTWTPPGGPLTAQVTVRVTDNGSPNLSDTATFTIAVNPLPAPPGPVVPPLAPSHNQRFVAQVYRDLLQQEADPASLALWSGRLDQGVSRLQVVRHLEHLQPFQIRMVQHLYRTLLHRQARQAELKAALRFLAHEGTLLQLEVGLLASEEYFQQRGGGTSAGFMQAVARDLLNQPFAPALSEDDAERLQDSGARRVLVNEAQRTAAAGRKEVQDLFQLLHLPLRPHDLSLYAPLWQHGRSAEDLLARIVASDEYFARL